MQEELEESETMSDKNSEIKHVAYKNNESEFDDDSPTPSPSPSPENSDEEYVEPSAQRRRNNYTRIVKSDSEEEVANEASDTDTDDWTPSGRSAKRKGGRKNKKKASFSPVRASNRSRKVTNYNEDDNEEELSDVDFLDERPVIAQEAEEGDVIESVHDYRFAGSEGNNSLT
ncbi:hypothetical protein K502DRAFT_233713 [Neoconidiobolus thromboides FSU 785]|nr:hypothetical protein K502DRAFT_233713 [Neoconidiobolus thromboides FSU 785]